MSIQLSHICEIRRTPGEIGLDGNAERKAQDSIRPGPGGKKNVDNTPVKHVDRRKIIESLIFQLEGNGFQDFCDRLGLELFPNDYHPVRAGGAYGDTKNDGYCPRARVFFAAHATRGESASKTKTKIFGDLSGCIQQHRDVKTWRFLTNDTLIGEVDQYIDNELRPAHPDISIEIWGHKRLADEINRLSNEQVERVLGVSLPQLPGWNRTELLEEAISISRARLIARWIAAGVSEAMADSFANDESIGTWVRIRDLIPKTGLVVVEGDFGSGKSVTAVRQYIADAREALRRDDTPLPLFLEAQDVGEALLDLVRNEVKHLGNPQEVGISLVLDGIDEPGPARARRLLDEARVLVHAWPNSRVVITSRPGVLSINQDDENNIDHPALTDEEATKLVERLGGHSSVLYSDSNTTRAMLRLPLFTIVAALRHKAGAEAPRSRGAFLHALVDEALKRTPAPHGDAYDALKRLAVLTVEQGGPVLEAELDDASAVQLCLETRLVIKADRTLKFALPVLEQYFAGQAVLESGFESILAANDLALMDRWRYPLMLAVTLGSWRRTNALLKGIATKYPGLASWLVASAVPNHSESIETRLPGDLECGQRIRDALQTLANSFNNIAPAFDFTTSEGNVGTLGISVADTFMTVAFKTRQPTNSPVTQLPLDWRPFGLRPSTEALWGPGRGGKVSADFAAWPWRFALWTLSSNFEAILKSQTLVVPGPFDSERRWALARTLVGQANNLLHKSIDVEAAKIGAMEVLSLMDKDRTTVANINPGRRGVVATRNELVQFIANIEDEGELVDGRLCRPYSIPDNLTSDSGWVDDLYTPETLRSLVERVHYNALAIYDSIVTLYFPRLRPMLGLGCIMPVSFHGKLRSGKEGWARFVLDYGMELLPLSQSSQAAVHFSEERPAWRNSVDDFQAEAKRVGQLIAEFHPGAEGWANPRFGGTVISVFGNMPATCQAYYWLWEDMKKLHLVESMAPHGEDW